MYSTMFAYINFEGKLYGILGGRIMTWSSALGRRIMS